VEGKVAFVTGAARGQGRSHAVRLAEEGADIIAVDLCHDIDSIGYPLARPEDLEETAKLVEKTGRGIVTAQADVRDASQLHAALERGMSEFGKLDIVVAQAGVAGMAGEPPLQAWRDVIETNLFGTINAIHVALPHLKEGAAIIATGSTAALMDVGKKDNPGADPGAMAYITSKRLLSQFVNDLGTELAPRGIRPTSSTRRTATPICCRADRCTGLSAPISNTRPAPTPSRCSLSNRRCKSATSSPKTSATRAVAGLRRGQVRHRYAVESRRRRLPQVV